MLATCSGLAEKVALRCLLQTSLCNTSRRWETLSCSTLLEVRLSSSHSLHAVSMAAHCCREFVTWPVMPDDGRCPPHLFCLAAIICDSDGYMILKAVMTCR